MKHAVLGELGRYPLFMFYKKITEHASGMLYIHVDVWINVHGVGNVHVLCIWPETCICKSCTLC